MATDYGILSYELNSAGPYQNDCAYHSSPELATLSSRLSMTVSFNSCISNSGVLICKLPSHSYAMISCGQIHDANPGSVPFQEVQSLETGHTTVKMLLCIVVSEGSERRFRMTIGVIVSWRRHSAKPEPQPQPHGERPSQRQHLQVTFTSPSVPAPRPPPHKLTS
jgi:hypothetical protein